MMGSIFSWITSADGVFFIINAWLVFLILFGLALGGFIHYRNTKDEKEAKSERKEGRGKS